MNHFDDQEPLSKIGIAAMFIGLLGTGMVAWGFVRGFFDWGKPAIFGDTIFLAVGGFLMWAMTKVACSKIAYRDESGKEEDDTRH